jgi:DNA-binding NarL/FixJ family response regulator
MSNKILDMIADGYTVQEVADELQLHTDNVRHVVMTRWAPLFVG